MKVYKRSINKLTAKPFWHQRFFENFNWDNFKHGDIVWLNDYPYGNNTCGIFVEISQDMVVIQMLTTIVQKNIAWRDITNINEMPSQKYWQNLIR